MWQAHPKLYVGVADPFAGTKMMLSPGVDTKNWGEIA